MSRENTPNSWRKDLKASGIGSSSSLLFFEQKSDSNLPLSPDDVADVIYDTAGGDAELRENLQEILAFASQSENHMDCALITAISYARLNSLAFLQSIVNARVAAEGLPLSDASLTTPSNHKPFDVFCQFDGGDACYCTEASDEAEIYAYIDAFDFKSKRIRRYHDGNKEPWSGFAIAAYEKSDPQILLTCLEHNLNPLHVEDLQRLEFHNIPIANMEILLKFANQNGNGSIWDKLAWAAFQGKTREVSNLLKQNVVSIEDDAAEFYLVYFAAMSNQFNTTKWLIKNRHASKFWALLAASQYGHVSLVNRLIAMGADVNQAHDVRSSSFNPQEEYFSGYTPICIAAMNGHVNCLVALYRAGADLEIKSGPWMGFTPLMMATLYSKPESAEKLLDFGADINAVNSIPEIVRNDLPCPEGCTALHLAVMTRNLTMTRLLLARNASVSIFDSYGFTPLHAAVLVRDNEIIQMLLAAGADINVRTNNADGLTPIGLAEKLGDGDTIRFLSERGAIRAQANSTEPQRSVNFTPYTTWGLSAHSIGSSASTFANLDSIVDIKDIAGIEDIENPKLPRTDADSVNHDNDGREKGFDCPHLKPRSP